MYVLPSHRDGYQGKAFLQRPRVHHGFYVKAFLPPVLMQTGNRYVTPRPTLMENPGSRSQGYCLLTAPAKLFLTPSSAHQPLLPSLPHTVSCRGVPVRALSAGLSVLFLCLRRSRLKSRCSAWFYGHPLGLARCTQQARA